MAVATQTIPQPSSVWARIRYRTIIIELVIGFIYIALNFPNTLYRLAHPSENEVAVFAPFIDLVHTNVQFTMKGVENHAIFQMPNLVALLFVEILIYVVLGFLLSIRTTLRPITIYSANVVDTWRPHKVLGPMLGGLLAGFIGLHVAAWLAIATIAVLGWIFYIIGSILSFISGLFAAIGRFILGLVIDIWTLFGWWLLLPIVILAAVFLFRQKFNLRLFLTVMFSILGLGVLFVVLPPILRFLVQVLQAITDFLMRYLAPLIRILLEFALWAGILLIKVVSCVFLLSFLGRLLIDQFRASATACDGPRGTFLGAFGVGSAVTLIFLGTVFQPDLANGLDQGWALAWHWLAGWTSNAGSPAIADLSIATLYRAVMPEWLYTFGSSWLSHRSTPLFDLLTAIVIMAMSCLVFCAQIFRSDVEVGEDLASFFKFELLKNFVLYFLFVLLLFLQGGDDTN